MAYFEVCYEGVGETIQENNWGSKKLLAASTCRGKWSDKFDFSVHDIEAFAASRCAKKFERVISKTQAAMILFEAKENPDKLTLRRR